MDIKEETILWCVTKMHDTTQSLRNYLLNALGCNILVADNPERAMLAMAYKVALVVIEAECLIANDKEGFFSQELLRKNMISTYTGFLLLHQLKEEHPHIPIIPLVSGDEAYIRHMLEPLGLQPQDYWDNFLRKPVFSEMEQAIKAL